MVLAACVLFWLFLCRGKPLQTAVWDSYWACARGKCGYHGISGSHVSNMVPPPEFALQFRGSLNKGFSLLFTYVLANVANVFTSQFSPKKLPTSPGTPHKVMHTLNDFCLICDCSLKQGKGEVIVYFNAVCSCPGLSRVLSKDVRPNESQRICRKCKTKTESAVKKIDTGKRLITELKSCYEKATTSAKMLRPSQKHNFSCFKSLLVIGLWGKILTSLLPPIQSCSSKFWAWSCIAGNFDKGWRGDQPNAHESA